ncbi:MAG: bifunctional diaminohydroxyphosphoribosylaminopyrimidine deaminase/5-amino-6-(5-phosphoribosylamino)uracil reductase RibD [Clostridia bacterium]|nr:bifunctional diaminohydroxyphosphoribosylaminopyrimidine deaminase/5-amino-6-(5-phosphoribosylamino)uracil reductase RibD [Clostridia bacterium]
MTDEEYMRRALELARRGLGHTNPNPIVGAVIVRDGRIIGEGWHEKYGELHAERNAIANCREDMRGATIYVTLEPCCHYGRTPPCTEALIEQGFSRVVVGSMDPNPLVAGKGVSILREHGMEVVTGVLKEECDAANRVFFHYISTKTPYVVLKYAMTADGKIATVTGESQWISNEDSRRRAHAMRGRYAAIMAGVGTVTADDPQLNCRIEGGRDPVRVICDSRLRTPIESKIVKTARDIPTIIATVCGDEERLRPYKDAGCEVILTEEKEGRVNLKELMARLGERKLDSVMIEGGAELAGSAVKEGIINEVTAFIAPKMVGGSTAKTPVGGAGIEKLADALKLSAPEAELIGGDIMIRWEVESLCLPG